MRWFAVVRLWIVVHEGGSRSAVSAVSMCPVRERHYVRRDVTVDT